MYNGIGLKTPRGSGTNGYVQRNLGFVRPRSSRPVYEDDGKRKEQTITKANKAILEHEKKREIEIQLIEMRDELEDQGVPDAEIDRRVDAKRATLFAAFEAQASSHSVRDADANSAPSFYELQSRGDLRMREETHAAAAAKEAENRRLEAALGISGFKEGASFDPEEQERRKEERKRRWEEAQRAKEEQSSRGRRSGVDDEQPSRGRVKRRRTSDRSSHSRSSSRSRSVSSRSRSASSSSSLSSRARSRSSRSTSRSRSASSSRSRSRSSASGSRSPSRSRSVSSRSEGSSRSRSRSASRSSGRRSRSRSPSPVAGMKGAEANNAPRDAPVRERSNESARQKGVSPSHGERSERQGGPGSQRGAPVSGDGFLRSAVGEIGEQGRQSSDEDREAVPDRPRLQSVIIVPERDPSPPRRPSGVRRFRSRSASRSYSRSRSPSRRYSRSRSPSRSYSRSRSRSRSRSPSRSRSRSRSASLSRSPSRSYSRSPSRSRSTARR